MRDSVNGRPTAALGRLMRKSDANDIHWRHHGVIGAGNERLTEELQGNVAIVAMAVKCVVPLPFQGNW